MILLLKLLGTKQAFNIALGIVVGALVLFATIAEIYDWFKAGNGPDDEDENLFNNGL